MNAIRVGIKDIQIILKDKKAMAVLILMPILLTTILGYALAPVFQENSNMGITKIPIAVVKGKPSDLSWINDFLTEEQAKELPDINEINLERAVFNQLLENEDVKEILDCTVMDMDTALKQLKGNEIIAVVLLPDAFTSSYIMGKKTKIQIIASDASSLKREVVLSIFSQFANALSIPRIGLNVILEESIQEGLPSPSYTSLQKNVEGLVPADGSNVVFQHVTQEGNKALSSKEYYTVAMAVMFILFAAGYGLESMIEERRQLTLSRVFVSGGRKIDILLGKLIFVSSISFMQQWILFLYTYFAFGIHWETNVPLLLMLSLCASLSIGGLCVLLCSFVKTEKGATVYQALIINMLTLLGGSFIPVYVLPKFIQPLSYLTPNGQALRGFITILKGGSLDQIFLNLLSLIGFGGICFMMGTILFRPIER
ncbi:MAG: ABC transporter permease [Bacillota bacterium]